LNILVADNAGFCFGVKKAVKAAYSTESSTGNSIYTYGPIIHNNMVVNDLEGKGVRQLVSINELKQNDTVIIRSHGVSKQVIQSLGDKMVNIIDATCPYVINIHTKVEEYYNKGYQIVIIGDPNHPEVQGINGWCGNSALIIDDDNKVEVLHQYPKLCIVSQTTFNTGKWKNIISHLLELSKELVIFNTICNATEQRQKSAQEIAGKCDAIIVLGGYNSSNTKKLFEICSNLCPKTYHVENIDELNTNEIKQVKTLGITAGASTPDWIIKEAINKMTNLTNTNEENINEDSLKDENVTEDSLNEVNTNEVLSKDENITEDLLNGENITQESLMNEYEKTLVRLHDGDIVKGIIISVADDGATVNVGYKCDGIIPRSEIFLEDDASPKDVLKSGEEVDVYILKVNDGEGNVLLSKKRVDAEKNILYIEECYKNKTKLDAKVTSVVKGGVTAEVKGVRIFIPASQIDNRFVDDLTIFSGQTVKIVIIEFDIEKRKIIGSRKIVLEEEKLSKKKSLLENIEVGTVLKGNVSRITDFGVFVDLNGIDGLIHVSELSWGRIKHPSEVVKVGDCVEVYVLSVDKEKERISLSLKKTLSDPWVSIVDTIHVGDIIEGKIVRIAPFGAFVEIEPGVDGLIHISQISEKRINKVEDALKVNELVKVKVMDLNTENKKLSLSIKEAALDELSKENDEIIDNQVQDEVTIADMINSKETE
jgi:(E)-4-hydroxy-3-methyl-but-2-enyl pyrophosphate reductase/ribosomal protein S1